MQHYDFPIQTPQVLHVLGLYLLLLNVYWTETTPTCVDLYLVEASRYYPAAIRFVSDLDRAVYVDEPVSSEGPFGRLPQPFEFGQRKKET